MTQNPSTQPPTDPVNDDGDGKTDGSSPAALLNVLIVVALALLAAIVIGLIHFWPLVRLVEVPSATARGYLISQCGTLDTPSPAVLVGGLT